MQPSTIERAIAMISPEWAYRRMAFRSALDVSTSTRAYDAAKTGRRTEGWYAPQTSANAELGRAAPKIRARVHDLVRNNPYASAVVRKLAEKVWGTGIVPRLNVGEAQDPRRGQARDIWQWFCDGSDPEGQLDFYGQGQVFSRTLFEGGEALIRYLPRPSSWRMKVPLQIEVLEGEQLDSTKNEALLDGGLIIQGVEFDRFGRRVAYWLFPEHPGDAVASFAKRVSWKSARVPAGQVRHVFEPLRSKQARGVSIFAPVVLKMKDLDDYDDAELMRKKIASCFAAFVTRQAGPAGSSLAASTTTGADGKQRIERFGPGLVQYLQPGEDIEFGAPPSAEGYVEYMKAQLRAIAVGCGVTYQMISGDLKDVNFSSMKIGQIDFDAQVDQWQWLMMIPQLCAPVWREVIAAASSTGRAVDDGSVPTWSPPARRYLDPKNDVEAEREAVRMGVKNLYDVIAAATGEDPEEYLLARQKENAFLDQLGLTFDSDPRKVGRTSAAATTTATAEKDKDNAKDEEEAKRMLQAREQPGDRPAGEAGTPPPSRGSRLLSVTPASYNAAEHTVEVIISNGVRVRRWFGFEELAITPEAVDLSRVVAGQCKLLDTHNQWGIDGILGSVLSARIENGALIGVVKFGETEHAKKAEAMVSRGELTGISAGYLVGTWRMTEIIDGNVEVWRADRWALFEVSFVSVPADATAGVRSASSLPGAPSAATGSATEDDDMQTRNQPGAAAAAPVATTQLASTIAAAAPAAVRTEQPVPAVPNAADSEAQRQAGIQWERTRQQTIRQRTLAAGLPDEDATTLITQGVTTDMLDARLVDMRAARGTQTPIRTPAGGLDETETRRGAIEEAILNRYNEKSFKLTDRAREYRGLRLMEIAREVLEARGEKIRGVGIMQVAERALHTGSDFPLIIANIANKTLQAGYAAEQRTFLPFCSRNDLPDFKQTQSTMLGEGSDLEQVNESGEFKSGTIGEGAEKWNLVTYGKIFGFTRQLLINDDMAAFTRLPYMFGQAGARKENDVVWGILTANANMADGVALFHAATHGNLQTGGGSVLQLTSLQTMRTNLRKQKGLDGKQTLNALLKFVMVPSSLETTLEQILSPALFAAQTSNVVPEFYRSLTPIVEARLDANSTTAWYGASDPGQMPTIDYGYLSGQEGVYLETKDGWRVDGIEVKVRFDFGAKAVNYRGLQKSNGA